MFLAIWISQKGNLSLSRDFSQSFRQQSRSPHKKKTLQIQLSEGSSSSSSSSLLKSTSARKTFAPYQQLQQFNPPRSKQSSSYQNSPQRSSSSAEDSILSHNAIPLPHKTTNSHFSTKFKHPAVLFSQNTEKK